MVDGSVKPEASDVPATPADTPVPVKKRSKRRNRCLIPVACVTAFILALNAAISLFLVQANTPVTVTFDMKGTVDAFMDQSSRKEMSAEQAAQLSARFSDALEKSLSDYQQAHHALVLVAPAVVRGAGDITAEIQQDVATRMRGGE